MTAQQRPFPLPSDFNGKRALRPLTRAVIAHARTELFESDHNASRMARSLWPDDKPTLGLVQRAATTEAATGDAAWAGPLATYRVQELLQNLGPLSAGSELLKRGIQLTFDGNYEIRVPGITVAATYATFVGEGQPIPVKELPVNAGAILQSRKFATIITLTREMVVSSNAEELVRAVLIDAVAASLDVALFSNTAGDATRPPGLLAGVIPIPAAGRVGSVADTAAEDLAALANAVTPYGGLELVYICAPQEAVKLTFVMGPQFKLPILASGGVPKGTVLCLAVNALCSASDPAPRLEAARDFAVAHMEDTTPAQIIGPTGTVAVPVKSFYQTDSVAIRLTMFVSWALRAPGATATTPGTIAWITGVNW
jgi:hypothetical protein